ncbi:hypothetical protein ACHAW6_015948 [Cyclotella cf. meneghiniana]
MGIFADIGYITIFHKGAKEATIHDHNDNPITSNKPAILQGSQDENGLWCVPLTKPHSILHEPTLHHINNVYNLSLMAYTIRYLHATLGCPTKTILLAAKCNGNLTTFPGLTVANNPMSSMSIGMTLTTRCPVNSNP